MQKPQRLLSARERHFPIFPTGPLLQYLGKQLTPGKRYNFLCLSYIHIHLLLSNIAAK